MQSGSPCYNLGIVVQRMHDQVAQVLDGKIDGYNLDADAFGDGFAWSAQSQTAGKILYNSLAQTSTYSYIRKKAASGTREGREPGVEIIVDASDATYGRVCILDKDNLTEQIISLIPQDPSSVADPGGTVKTPSGALTFDTGGNFDVVVKRNSVTGGTFTTSKFTTPFQIESTLAIGTKPLAITSTTKCDNLNADLLDGYHAATAPAASIVPVTDGTSTRLLATTWLQMNTAKVLGRTTDSAGAVEEFDWSAQGRAILNNANLTAGYIPKSNATGGALANGPIDDSVTTASTLTFARKAQFGTGLGIVQQLSGPTDQAFDITSAVGRHFYLRSAGVTGATGAGTIGLIGGAAVDGAGGTIDIRPGAASGAGTNGSVNIRDSALNIKLQISAAGVLTLAQPTIADFTLAGHNHEGTAGGGTLDHGAALMGLGDDDHPQYQKASTLNCAARFVISNATTDRVLDAETTTLAEIADVLATMISDLSTTGVLTGYTITSGTDRAWEPGATTIDEIADVLGTLISDIQTNSYFPASLYSITTRRTSRVLNCDACTANQIIYALTALVGDLGG